MLKLSVASLFALSAISAPLVEAFVPPSAEIARRSPLFSIMYYPSPPATKKSRETREHLPRQPVPEPASVDPEDRLVGAILIKPPVKNTEAWSGLIPKDSSNSVDCKITWKATDERPSDVASRWITTLESATGLDRSLPERRLLQERLQDYVETFTSFCIEQLGVDQVAGRLVVTRGVNDRPVFEQDELPVRWVHPLVGPGCHWVQQSHVDRDEYMTAYDEQRTSATDRNIALVSGWGTQVNKIKEGEAAMLLGSQ